MDIGEDGTPTGITGCFNNGLCSVIGKYRCSSVCRKDIDRLLEAIIDNARLVTHADGGTLYLLADDRRVLNFAIVQNDTLGTRMGGRVIP